MKNLVIVESPAKCKTITKYLGKDYQVLASYGHVRDLLPKKGSVDPDNDFKMTYELIEKNTKHVNEIVAAIKKSDALYLATDPDREGEAISWHLYEVLKAKKLLKDKPVRRVVFHEITKSAIVDAVAHPREISMDLVNAQQARRALDYLVGFNLSPLLWKKVARGLSAGRVQSPALRLIVEREEEIERFIAQEYWSITADLLHPKGGLKAKLSQYLGKPLKQFDINNEKDAKDALQVLTDAAEGKLKVIDIEKKQKQRQPAAPFITSTLQQEAVKKLGFTSKKAMMIAQNLYEGIDVGDESVGLITYMRTDSIILSNDALAEARQFIEEKYGKDLVPDAPRVFKSKSKNAQEAHEAIRPTSFYRTPDSVKQYLSADQFKLYQLIWQRAIASQMENALIDTVGIDLAAGDKGVFRATGSTIAKPGFLTVYQETNEDKKEDEDEEGLLPPLVVGELIDIKELIPKQHFTEPPPRYSEASLVKALEEFGIGRPSTYASIISTLQQRKYTELENKRFKPTDVGRVVNKFLTEYFTQYVDYDFTAKLEDQLDDVAEGKQEWIPLLEKFWSAFYAKVGEIDSSVKRSDVTQEALDENCPECSKPLSIRLSRNGRFIGCTGYPECKYTRSVEQTAEEAKAEALEEEKLDRACPDCGHPLMYRKGRFGKFIGCTNYPKCKHIESLTNKAQPAGTGIECPECQKGEIVARKSRYGKLFYSCNRYPDCKYALWNEPVKESCPKCAWPITTLKTTKRRGTEKVCPKEGCGHTEVVTPPEK
jgi:DNA topoisomerase-1